CGSPRHSTMSDSPNSSAGPDKAGRNVPAAAPEPAVEATGARTERAGQMAIVTDGGAPELREPSTGFPVVGAGAAAGGLEALEAFLSRLPRTGMAFIVIQHLAPGRESHLPEILARSTPLPVTQATDAQTVEPDHVYVIPPGVNLAMFQGKLHLMDV